MGAGRPFRAKASYMSVQFGAFKYRYLQELSQSSRESANGARPRTRQFVGFRAPAGKGKFASVRLGAIWAPTGG